MHNDLPRYVDLEAIAAELATSPEQEAISDQLRRAARTASCLADLKQSLMLVETLRERLASSPEPAGPHWPLEYALQMQAIVLYGRATSTQQKRGSGGERGSIAIEAKLTPAQLEDHNLLLRTRNRAIAHVYHDEEIDDETWFRGAFIAVEIAEGNWLPGAFDERLEVHHGVLVRLERQLPIAISLLREAFHKRLDILTASIRMADDLEALFQRHLVDPVSLMGSREAVIESYEGISAGEALGRHAAPRSSATG
jgi:hypothetical protein